MSDSLDAIRDAARDYLGRQNQRDRKRALQTAAVAHDRARWGEIAESGWLMMLVPEAQGGLGLGLAEVAAIAEEVGVALLPEPFVGAGVLPMVALLAVAADGTNRTHGTHGTHGTDGTGDADGINGTRATDDGPHGHSKIEHLIESASAGTMMLGLAWQDEAGALDLDHCGTRCARHADGWIVEGAKHYVCPGSGEDGWLVVADAGPGDAGARDMRLLWIKASDGGVSLSTARQVDGSALATLQLSNVRIGADRMLAAGQGVTAAVNRALDVARLIQAAELLGVARRTLALTTEYMKTRVQFGRPIGSFQALQHRLVDAYIQIELSAASLDQAISGLAAAGTDVAHDANAEHGDDGQAASAGFDVAALDARELALSASRVKARAARAALHMTRLSVQLHGAIAYTDEYEVGMYLKRALHLGAWLGNAAALQRRYGGLQSTGLGHGAAPHDAHAGVADADWPAGQAYPREADWENMPEPDFRRMLRGFFRDHYPESMRHLPWRVHWHEIKDWYLTLARQGWLAPSWPRQFGGMELPAAKHLAYIEEQERYGVARPPDQGLVMLGPILIRYGTPAQQQHYMPRILSGEHVWAQGYSEPNAGSDLASLRCEATVEGDVFIVNGQKTWSTLAQDATHMFMLVRTDKTVKKQEGISFLLVDLASPGVTVRPIVTLTGDAEFAEVFFDNVRVPRDNLVGGLNQGWTIAKALLGFERIFSGSPKHSQYALALVRQVAALRGSFNDPVWMDRYASVLLDVADLSASYAHFAAIIREGRSLPANVSLLKIWATETHERIGQLLIEMSDEEGGAHQNTMMAGTQVYVLQPLMSAMAATIFSGTNEVQRNIIAKAVLGLPS